MGSATAIAAARSTCETGADRLDGLRTHPRCEVVLGMVDHVVRDIASPFSQSRRFESGEMPNVSSGAPEQRKKTDAGDGGKRYACEHIPVLSFLEFVFDQPERFARGSWSDAPAKCGGLTHN